MKSIDVLSLARANVKALKPYSSARDDFQGAASVFLDANENPFQTGYNRYPDPHQRQLKEAVASLRHVSPDNLLMGNGSDEVIDLLLRVFCEPGEDHVIIPQPTYGMYAVSAAINNVKVVAPNLSESFDLDSVAVLDCVLPATKLIFLCSPNNPSGNLLNAKEVEKVANGFNGIVIIDEAYIDFTESPGWISRLGEYQNIVVMQTFSKAWGLAGLRLGMCFADPSIIALMKKIKPPYNINAHTQSSVLHAVQSGESKKNNRVKEIRSERERLCKELSQVSVVKRIFPSEANFLLIKVAEAKTLYQTLLQHGIVVRDRSSVPLCDNCLRITIGTREENDQLIQVLDQL